ncbi:checkpoint protein Hus1/Mec3 [Lipomyces tetrasporus]
MRFIANMQQPDTLRAILHGMSFLRKHCLLRVTDGRFTLISFKESLGQSATQIWTHLELADIFSEIQIGSLDNDHINMELNLDHFVRALKSCSSSSDTVKVKLAKRGRIPYLVVAVDSPSYTSIKQEIPVKVIRENVLEGIAEPTIPNPDVSLELYRHVRSVLRICERYRNLTKHITIAANRAGNLRISIQNDDATVDAKWTNLTLMLNGDSPEDDDELQEDVDDEKFFSIVVNADELFHTLRICYASRRIIFCISDQYTLMLHVLLAGMDDHSYVSYYIPSSTL